MWKLNKLLIELVVVIVVTIALLPGSAFAAGDVGWLPWGSGHWTYCDYYPDSPNYYGDYWCYMPENGNWKPVSPNWQSGTGFSPGEFPD